MNNLNEQNFQVYWKIGMGIGDRGSRIEDRGSGISEKKKTYK